MPSIAQLFVYPVKSCAGIAASAATVTRHGLALQGVHDREWMVVSPAGEFLTQREHPRLALVTPAICGDALELAAPGQPRLALPVAQPAPGSGQLRMVQVWDDAVPAFDCGDAAARWFGGLLGVACRLVRFPRDVQRLASMRWTGGIAAPTRFADGYPFLVIGSSSLDDLNARLRAHGREPLPMDRFRPNVVVGGMEAYEEDYAQSLRAAAVELRPVKPCARCPIPSVDQRTGVPGPDPLDILSGYRANVRLDGAATFGMNAILVEGEGSCLSVGQVVEAGLAFGDA